MTRCELLDRAWLEATSGLVTARRSRDMNCACFNAQERHGGMSWDQRH